MVWHFDANIKVKNSCGLSARATATSAMDIMKCITSGDNKEMSDDELKDMIRFSTILTETLQQEKQNRLRLSMKGRGSSIELNRTSFFRPEKCETPIRMESICEISNFMRPEKSDTPNRLESISEISNFKHDLQLRDIDEDHD